LAVNDEGYLKNNKLHGEGTLYSESGNIKHKGELEMEINGTKKSFVKII
jgi:antitoxin component YwqK of YwqJK toxin-antitoxin module